MDIELYNFDIPDELIAQSPLDKRSDSRLLVYDRRKDSITDSHTKDLASFLDPDTLLVFNNSKVIPARIFITKKDSGRKGELLVLRCFNTDTCLVIVDKKRKYPLGTIIILPSGDEAIIRPGEDDLTLTCHSQTPGLFTYTFFDQYGTVPLPPYIKKEVTAEDKLRYQTVFSSDYGSAAAPTAGLHFDNDIFSSLVTKGITHTFVTLHVGLGTFQPIYSKTVEGHSIHHEWYSITNNAASMINSARLNGNKIIPVGTTSLRTLESATKNGILHAGAQETDLYIYPPYDFQMADGLFTNFHTPKSSLLVLVSAMLDLSTLKAIYAHAVEKKYRFFSYGDAMLIL